MSKKISLTKVLALGATSTALLSGAMMMNNNKVEASSSSIVLLKFKHNAYRYNKNGKRIGRGYITKGSTYYSKGAYRIHGKKYHKLDTKGNIYVKDGNLSTRRLTDQVTLKHNAYIYNIHGRRINRQKLYKGVSYFIYGSRYINGKKYYQIGVKEYIKASNASAPFSTYGQSSNNDVDNTTNNSNVSNNNTQTNTNTNVGSNTSSNNSSVTNNQFASNNSSSSANNNIQLPNNSSQGSSTGNQGSTTKPSAGNSGSQVTKPNTGSQGQETQPSQPTYSKNYVKLPAGYLEAVKNANWEKTSVPDELIRKGVEINNFHSESKADDEMKIDSDNLTPAQDFEINDFALRLINNVRSENGQQPWHYSARAQHVADRVAYLYEQDHMGLSTWHDDKALNEVDREAGIHTAELMGGDNVNYKEDYLNTMTDLKRAVYNDVVAMLFSTVELRHAQIMLTYNSIDNPTTYFGFSVSWQAHNKDGHQEHSDHFIAY
ncbi:SEC10/PgrA surface exclusion domain-containing protein [Lactobacillus gallinarum]|uniref:SEC10/PgrA surface exclusion domain-containing protein n=1 Tax=Lactobacillus gallinarum TaxID=52242 RepID=UPI0024B94E39|nr:SEC10/PgrA surface exclusion domain-containing protein [Lactobacillus gallinarum]